MAKTFPPHEIDTADEIQLATYAVSDLRDYSKQRGIRVPPAHKSRKQAWIDAILVSRVAALEIEEDEPEDEALEDDDEEESTEDGDEAPEAETEPTITEEPEPEGIDETVISPKEARQFDGSTNAMIRDWLVRHPEARPCLVEYAGLVLARRETEERIEREKEALKTPVAKQYVVKVSSRFCFGGAIHRLAAGSLISELTHDLDEVRRQGIQIEEVKSVSLSTDHMGRPFLTTE